MNFEKYIKYLNTLTDENKLKALNEILKQKIITKRQYNFILKEVNKKEKL